MIALILVCGLAVIAVSCVLTWRWLEVHERIGVEREKAGGSELAQTVIELTGRVEKIERYMSGEDVKGGPA
jgi:hypothetical protein